MAELTAGRGSWWQKMLGLGRKSSGVDQGLLAWLDVFGRTESKAGQAVTVTTAMQCAAWFCAARVIAEGLAQPPCRVVQEDEDGTIRIARDHSLYWLLHRKPNDWQTSFEFREQLGLHLVFCGQAFVFINRRADGTILELLPFEPGQVTITRHRDKSITYRLMMEDGQSVVLTPYNMWHLKGPSWNGWSGLHAVKLARNVIGLGLAAEEFGSELFANGARPSGYLKAEGSEQLNPEDVDKIRSEWAETHTGSGNRHKTAVLAGLAWQAISSTAEEAQFLETRKFQVVEICRMTRVLPIMVMHQEGSAAYASVEQMFLAHVTHTLGPWWERFVQSAEVALFTPRELEQGYTVKLYEQKMIRGTAKDRAETNAIMKQNGVISANNWRRDEDLSRSDDPDADRLIPATNLYGPTPGSQQRGTQG